jgi:hypothetical protein
MKIFPILLLILLFTGCVSSRSPGTGPSVVAAARTLSGAGIGVVQAQAGARKARVAIRSASDAVALLSRTATPEQRPAVATVRLSMNTARQQLDHAEAQLLLASNSLDQSGVKLTLLQQETNKMAADLDRAHQRANGYYRLKFWLALAGAGFGFYVALRILPPLGPYRWYGALAAAAVFFGALWIIL